MKEPFAIAGMKDVEAIEAVPFNERVAETNTFAVLEKVPPSNRSRWPSVFF